MNRPDTKSGDELLARMVLRAALGAKAKQHDDGSLPRMHDIDIVYPDARLAAAEVISTRNEAATSLEAAAVKIGYVPRQDLTRIWAIVAEPDAHLRDLRRAAPTLLANLERAGVADLRGFSDPWSSQLRSIGVKRAWSYAATAQRPPGFFINAPPSAGIVRDGNDAVQACSGLLAMAPDVLAKLRDSKFPERHAVVIITVDWLDSFSSIEAGAMPTTAPTLPDGVDCLWMVTLKFPPIRAVYWLGDGKWRDVVLLQEDLSALGD